MRDRSSLIAAATVCMSRTDGADSFSRSCSTCSDTGSRSCSLNEARTADARGPVPVARAT